MTSKELKTRFKYEMQCILLYFIMLSIARVLHLVFLATIMTLCRPWHRNGWHRVTGKDMEATPRTDSLIEYPSDFPIKIMGPTHIDFAPAMVLLVLGFDPTFHEGKMESRPSGKGNYTGLTATVRATSREQLDALYMALSAHPMVKIVM